MSNDATTLPRDRDILLYHEDHGATRQPEKPIVCSSHGVELYSRNKIEPFKVLQVQVQVPEAQNGYTDIHCSGVVVDCTPESDLYRLRVKFLDFPQTAARMLEATS